MSLCGASLKIITLHSEYWVHSAPNHSLLNIDCWHRTAAQSYSHLLVQTLFAFLLLVQLYKVILIYSYKATRSFLLTCSYTACYASAPWRRNPLPNSLLNVRLTMPHPQDCQYPGYCSLAEVAEDSRIGNSRFVKEISRQLHIPTLSGQKTLLALLRFLELTLFLYSTHLWFVAGYYIPWVVLSEVTCSKQVLPHPRGPNRALSRLLFLLSAQISDRYIFPKCSWSVDRLKCCFQLNSNLGHRGFNNSSTRHYTIRL